MTKGHESCCYYFNDHEKKSLFLSIQTCYIIDMGYKILSDYNETFISNVFSRNIELVHAQVISVYTEQILPVITLNGFPNVSNVRKIALSQSVWIFR
jgi:predicted regulator of amino acid metabolism with ACT domain